MFLDRKNFGPKIFFLTNKMFGPKRIWEDEKNFGSENILGLKKIQGFFMSKNILDAKIFWAQTNFGSKK